MTEELTRREVAEKFIKLAKERYPDVGEPGVVMVLADYVGWDWEKISRTAVDGFSREGYRLFIIDPDTDKRTYGPNGNVLTVTRRWTREERRILKDWWWLLGL